MVVAEVKIQPYLLSLRTLNLSSYVRYVVCCHRCLGLLKKLDKVARKMMDMHPVEEQRRKLEDEQVFMSPFVVFCCILLYFVVVVVVLVVIAGIVAAVFGGIDGHFLQEFRNISKWSQSR